MASLEDGLSVTDYGDALADYLRSHSEHALLRASDISRLFVEGGLGPEDVIALHIEALEKILPSLSHRDQPRAFGDAQQFLLDTMINYGVKYKDYLELKLQQVVNDAEAHASRERDKVLEAERIHQEGREILEMIAHELRTPITAARGNLDLASRSLSQGRIEPATRFVGTARDVIDRLSRLTADLVEASRGKSPELDLTVVDLTTVLGQACTWAKVTAANKGVKLEFLGGDPSVFAIGNADALQGVCGNLLYNAIRYTAADGTVTARVFSSDRSAIVEVSDTGIGMTPDVMARIFEKFYRAPMARRIDAQGLGLGLSLVQQMVAAHGGRIEVESEPNQGSTFRVHLPIAECPNPSP